MSAGGELNGDVIKSFLVGLGFGVDETSLSKFNKALLSATAKVTALYTATNVMAAAIVKSISNISGSFEQMGYEYRIIAPAINKALVLRNELLKAYSAAGINITKAIQASVKLNMSLTKTKFALDAVYKSVGMRFFGVLTKQSDLFRQKIYQNMPKIQATLEHFVNFVFKAFESVTQLGERLWSILTRVYDFFVMLDKATDGWSTIILGVLASWKLLNLAFLATPLGMLITGLTTLLALWDDFKTFKEGGQSLINWGSDFTKIMVGLVSVITTVIGLMYAWKTATSALSTVLKVFNAIETVTAGLTAFLELPLWAIVAVVGALIAGLTVLDAKWNIFGGHLSNFFSGIGDKLMGFLGGSPNVGANLSSPVSAPGARPLGSNVANNNNQSNTNVSQQTSISVIGSADANKTAQAVASQQGRVNRDLTDNLIGSTR